jgi:hypothetical protein
MVAPAVPAPPAGLGPGTEDKVSARAIAVATAIPVAVQ